MVNYDAWIFLFKFTIQAGVLITPRFHNQPVMVSKNNGKKKESTKKLLVRPVDTVVAPATCERVTETDAVLEFPVYPLVLVILEVLFKVVVPYEKLAAPATWAWYVMVTVWLGVRFPRERPLVIFPEDDAPLTVKVSL